jgi:hypothetical protein
MVTGEGSLNKYEHGKGYWKPLLVIYFTGRSDVQTTSYNTANSEVRVSWLRIYTKVTVNFRLKIYWSLRFGNLITIYTTRLQALCFHWCWRVKFDYVFKPNFLHATDPHSIPDKDLESFAFVNKSRMDSVSYELVSAPLNFSVSCLEETNSCFIHPFLAYFLYLKKIIK